MGQEVSNQIDDSVPPQTLSARSLDAVAQLIRDGKAPRIIAMTGAGISTSAGIPDFRSPGTGLYNNLQRLDLPHAEAVFSIDYFRQNPRPFYVLAKDLYPGQFHPTVSHAFLALIARKGLLRMLFTQNIDCLERAAGVDPESIVEAHGSFATQRCIDCHTPYPDDAMRAHVREARVPRCLQPGCGGLVKPDIVFFGESLPARFHQLRALPATEADLVLVLGTSLSVYPFAGLPAMAPDRVPRVLFNRETVGDLGTRPDDVLVLGSCDAGVRRLADALGWLDELETMWRGLVGEAEADRQIAQDALFDETAVPRYDSDSDSEPESLNKAPNTHEEKPEKNAADDEDVNNQPPEIGAPLTSAEIEVNEITHEIEELLKLEDDEATATRATTASGKPLPPSAQSAAAETPDQEAANEAASSDDAPALATTDMPKPAGSRPQL